MNYELLSQLKDTQPPDAFLYLLDQCVNDVQTSLDEVKIGLQDHDIEPVKSGVHKLKSLSGTFGMHALFVLSDDLNAKAGAGVALQDIAEDLMMVLTEGDLALKLLKDYQASQVAELQD